MHNSFQLAHPHRKCYCVCVSVCAFLSTCLYSSWRASQCTPTDDLFTKHEPKAKKCNNMQLNKIQ